jgi:hypothetical protein
MVVLNDGVIMEYAEKEKLFEDFMRRWGDRFAMVPPIIRMLASYPEFVRKIGPLVTEGLDRSQLEWVALLAQCTHPIERVFYKDYWVPIQTEEYDFVIDISTDNFAIFDTQYIQYTPECWYKRMLIPDLRSFLIELNNADFDFDALYKAMNEQGFSKVLGLIRVRSALKCKGIPFPFETLRETLFLDLNPAESYCRRRNNMLILKGVSPFVIGLFPQHFNIYRVFLDPIPNFNWGEIRTIEIIRGLTHFIEMTDPDLIEGFIFGFDFEGTSRVWYRNKTLYLKHHNPALLDIVADGYREVKEAGKI